MSRFIPYDQVSSLIFVENGDKIWRDVPVDAEPRFESRQPGISDENCIKVEYTFVASINVDHKFKVYYSDARHGLGYIIDNGYKLPRENENIARQIFPDLFLNGWEFIT